MPANHISTIYNPTSNIIFIYNHTSNFRLFPLESSAPKINPFHFPSELAMGMRASVQCTVMLGDPPFDFAWFKDGQRLDTDHRRFSIRIIDDFTMNLVIASVDADSNGNFTCRVSNSVGYDEKSAVLSIKGIIFE